MSETFEIELDGKTIEIERDDDGKFIIPDRFRNKHTALKPAHEPIVLAQKPYEDTYAKNVLKHGVGGLNIDRCRVEHKKDDYQVNLREDKTLHAKGKNVIYSDGVGKKDGNYFHPRGRWPANLILDPKSAKMLDEQSGERGSFCLVRKKKQGKNVGIYSPGAREKGEKVGFNDKGGASRFFYCAKAHKSERNAGLEDLEMKEGGSYQFREDGSLDGEIPEYRKNDIATLKPINLMRYLVRLVTPPDGIVLDPFAGSGTTACACKIEGFNYILIEKRARFAKVIAPKRIDYWSKEGHWDELQDHNGLPSAKERKNKKLSEVVP